MINELIQDHDEECLESLLDIKYRYLEGNPGFVLEFVFAENPFFTNQILTKTYFLEQDENGEMGFEHAEGTKIDWKEGKQLDVKTELKKQRHKATNKTRTVKKSVPCDTFFNFFTPPNVNIDQVDEDQVIFFLTKV